MMNNRLKVVNIDTFQFDNVYVYAANISEISCKGVYISLYMLGGDTVCTEEV